MFVLRSITNHSRLLCCNPYSKNENPYFLLDYSAIFSQGYHPYLLMDNEPISKEDIEYFERRLEADLEEVEIKMEIPD